MKAKRVSNPALMFLSKGWVLGVLLAMAAETTQGVVFMNTGSITINDATSSSVFASATPFPSEINISGQGFLIASVTVTLHGFSHSYPQDVAVALQGPDGTSVMLMNAPNRYTPVSGLELTFSQSASVSINSLSGSGEYRPGSQDAKPMTSPGPALWSTSLTRFDGKNANGTWKLFVEDRFPDDTGSISGGWSMDIEFSPTPVPEPEHYALIACLGLGGFALLRRRLARRSAAES